MKSSKLIMGCIVALGLSAGAAVAQEDAEHAAIAERLAPVGELCLQGEDCGSASAPAADSGSSGGAADGEAIYNSVCMACHDTGAANAPIHGDEADWADRVTKGFETLLDHSTNGFNAMPARGGNPNLSDEEMLAATKYMVEPVMDVPADEAPAADDVSSEATSEDSSADDESADKAPTEEASSGKDAVDDDAASNEAEASSADSESSEATDSAATSEEQTGPTAAMEEIADVDGEAVYNGLCMACHSTGVSGAPIKGNADEWGPRIDQGMATLYDHSLHGLNAMPAKGGNPSLSDDEVKAAVNYMVNASQ